jgi:hypothetical protein
MSLRQCRFEHGFIRFNGELMITGLQRGGESHVKHPKIFE